MADPRTGVPDAALGVFAIAPTRAAAHVIFRRIRENFQLFLDPIRHSICCTKYISKYIKYIQLSMLVHEIVIFQKRLWLDRIFLGSLNFYRTFYNDIGFVSRYCTPPSLAKK